MYKKRTKVIASILVFMLTMAHFNIIGQVIATSLEGQTGQTNHANVEFDAYFKKEGKKVHSATNSITEQNNLTLSLAVKEAGYLKNAILETTDANFHFVQTEHTKIAKVEENKLYFNQIKNGESFEIDLPIQITSNNQIAIEELNKQNTIHFIATYVDGNGKEKQINKEIKIQLAWTSEKQAELNMQVAKFIPYDVNGNKGLVLQTVVQSYLKDNSLPVKQNKIQIEVPTIHQYKPQDIKVMANSTKATNGDETGVNFTESNYTYNQETNQLIISVENTVNEQGKISWQKEAQDEFIVTYIYSEEALNSLTEEGINISIQANSELTTYEANQEKVEKEFLGEITLKEQISNLVDFSVETNVAEISKGQIYANYETKQKIETQYEETLVANIGLAELTDKIILEQKVDDFLKENEKVQANETYNKTITVDQAQVSKILGQDFEIHFYVENTEIAKIDKDTPANEQGKFVLDVAELNINHVRIETSKPQTEGKLTFTINKAVKGEIGYQKAQVATFQALGQNIIGKAVNGQINFVQQEVQKEIPLTETTSQAELIIDNNNLSTMVTNRDVKLTAVLKTDTLSCSLYQNPALQIIMPSYIENITIKDIEVLFDTEDSKLTLQSYDIKQNTDGTKTITIILEGTQTAYTLSAVSKGVNVVITTDMTVNKLTANKQDQIRMIYTNQNTTSKARTAVETHEVTAPISIVAPTGVVTTTTISNYQEGAEDITAISGEEKTATIATLAEARNAKFTMSVINNYNNSINNVRILGRIPSKGNLDSTISMPLVEAITVSGVEASNVTIYYSENANETENSNGWTTTPTNLQNVKSYLIIIKDITMNTADVVNFSYVAQIPANLQHNESAYENYEVYFNNNLETGVLQDKQIATKLGVTTGKGPVLEANISSNTPKAEEKLTGSIIAYTLTLTNTGTETAENVTATIPMPQGLNYVEKDETKTTGYKTIATSGNDATISLGNIAPNQTINKEILTKVGILSASEGAITSEVKANISASNIAGTLETQTVENTLAPTDFIIASTVLTEREVLRESDEYTYHLEIISSSIYETKQDTVLEITFPEEIIYQNVEVHWKESDEEPGDIQYNKNTKVLTIQLGEIDGRNPVDITLKVKVGTLAEGVYDKQVNITAKVSAKEAREQYADIDPVQIGKIGFRVVQSSNIPENTSISAGEDFTYIFTIENLSNMNLYNVKFTDLLPEELTLNHIKVTSQSGSTKSSYRNSITLTMNPKETITVEVNVSANILDETKTISNKAKIEYETISPIETSTYTHIINQFKDEDYPTDPSNPSSQTKRIMGTVWIDENRNGVRDEQEEKVPNVEVLLFNNQTGTLVTDSQGNIARTTTDANGTYTFAGIYQGKYTVIFLYDSANYSATGYKMENVDVSMNSDAIDSQITLNGETRTAAITEEIIVTDSNIYSIDLGLISNPKFDLKLDKTVSKITVQDATGTNVYECKDSKLAKKDLVGKQIANTTIVVEYKIKVTNEGAISGFVKKIADYMPSEMKFSSELNPDWYTSGDGVLFNASLANTIINPGESKEVTLTLTKKMTENNLGLYHNEAEIYEAYNDLGIADTDSTVANKTANEDDISSADVLISVKTGEVMLFAGLSISIITTIAISAYFIKKKVLR